MDMLRMVEFGKKMSKHFLNCEPMDCIRQINEVLGLRDTTPLDYNFLIGVRYGIEEQL